MALQSTGAAASTSEKRSRSEIGVHCRILGVFPGFKNRRTGSGFGRRPPLDFGGFGFPALLADHGGSARDPWLRPSSWLVSLPMGFLEAQRWLTKRGECDNLIWRRWVAGVVCTISPVFSLRVREARVPKAKQLGSSASAHPILKNNPNTLLPKKAPLFN